MSENLGHHRETNRANWDDRAAVHAAEGGLGYGIDRYVSDRELLSDVVRFDLERLGDISGLRAVHLQCHIGTDTISLARLGARVTGLDFSSVAIERARGLVELTGDAADFVESDVYAATEVLETGGFDLVYTGIGALCWLPSIDRWAATVSALLRPGGRLFIREGHPVLWSMNETLDDDLHLRFPYFEMAEPLEWDSDETYVATDRPLTATKTYEWNHGMSEIVTALLDHGLRITGLVEHRTVPWEALPGQMVEVEGGEYRLDALDGVAPLTYTLQAVKD
jgi:SAM-dependent methyltransferase